MIDLADVINFFYYLQSLSGEGEDSVEVVSTPPEKHATSADAGDANQVPNPVDPSQLLSSQNGPGFVDRYSELHILHGDSQPQVT